MMIAAGVQFHEHAEMRRRGDILRKIRAGCLSLKELLTLGVTKIDPIPGATPGPVVVAGFGLNELTTEGLAVANPNLDPGTGTTTVSYNGNASTAPISIAETNCSSGKILPVVVPAGQTFVITAASISSLSNPPGYSVRLETTTPAALVSSLTANGSFGNVPYTVVAGANIRIIMLKQGGATWTISFSWALTGYYQTAAGAPGVPPSFNQLTGDDIG